MQDTFFQKPECWIDILQKEHDFLEGIFGVLLGRIFGFWWEKYKELNILRKNN